MSKDSQTLFPNKALEAALHSLDVDLEQEIFRYRRRRGIQRASDRGLLTLSSSPKLDSIVTTRPEAPNSETIAPNPLEPKIEPRNAALREPVGGLARTEAKNAPPGDYLASSEQLLRSLADTDPKSLQQSKNSSWLNPLGIAALLVLLVAGGALAYVLNPNLWANLVGGKKETEVTSTTTAPAIAKKPSQPQIPAVSAPNLAANSNFSDLKFQDLSSVQTPPSIYPKPTTPVASIPAIKNPAVNTVPGVQNPQNLVSALIPLPQTSTNAAKSQQPASNSAQLSAEGLPKLGRPPLNGKIYYYVLTDYANNKSLIQGRRIARDAFVVKAPGGKKVQIATFIRKTDADALVKKLRSRGISATVYQD